jgi:site-specific recombinase XerD
MVAFVEQNQIEKIIREILKTPIPCSRAAYYRAIEQFLFWCERAGYQDLEDIEPITVAAYIETLQRQAAPATVKQHMAAIRMLFSWLTEKGSWP